MCGGGGGDNTAAREQALSARVRQGEQDMISRVNRGLEIRRLLTPEQAAARMAAERNGPNAAPTFVDTLAAQISEDVSYEY